MYSLKYDLNTPETTDLLREFCPKCNIDMREVSPKRPSLMVRRAVVLSLVRRALIDVFHVPLEEALTTSIGRETSGAPYLIFPDSLEVSPALHISISHTGPWVSFILSDSGAPITLDVEEIQKQRSFMKIAQAVFSQQEQAYVKQYGALGFYFLWGAKETIAKWYKEGLSFALKIDLSGQLYPPASNVECLVIYEYKEFLMSFFVEDSLLITTCKEYYAEAS